MGDIKKAMVAVRRIFDITDDLAKKVTNEGSVVLQDIGDIEFKDVTFA